MKYDCQIKELNAQPTLAIQTRTPVQNLPKILGESYTAIMEYMGELEEQPVGAPFVMYYNMDIQDLDIEIGFPVSKKFSDKGNIKVGEFPGGKIASLVFIGPYDKMEPAYNALSKWIEDNGFEATGVAIERYFSGPETPPEEIKTEILLPLK